MIVRELEDADASVAHAEHVSNLMTGLAGEARSISADELRVVVRANHVFAAIEAGVIVGIVCLVPMRLPQGVRLWVESVIVHPNYRRSGIGRQLMEAALERADRYGAVPVSLTSNPTRVHAHELFGSLGFKPADTTVFRRAAKTG